MIPSLSVIIPVYNSADTIEAVFASLSETVPGLTENYEYIFVDDGSTDGSFSVLFRLHERFSCCTVIKLRENRGQQNALLCGLRYVTKEYAATIDDDLRHNPADIGKLYLELLQTGADAVYGIYALPPKRRGFRRGGFREGLRRAGSGLVDLFFTRCSGKPPGVKAGSFRLTGRSTVDRIVSEHPAEQPFIYITAALLRFSRNIASVRFPDAARQPPAPFPAALKRRRSRYSFGKLVRLFLRLCVYYGGIPGSGMFRRKGGPFTVETVLPPRPPDTRDTRKKILFLGSGNNQINPIRRGKELGYYIIASDYFAASPGKAAADASVTADAFYPEATLEAAGWLQPDGVITTGTDQTVVTMAAVAEKLGLPSYIDTETARNVTDKGRMKRVFAANDIPALPWMLLSRPSETGPAAGLEALRRLRPPLVVKPPDSQGQRGVLKLASAEEVLDHMEDVLRYSRQGNIIVEEYYQSDELTVSGWVENGRARILSVTDRETFEQGPHIGICRAHMYPSKHLPELGDEIETLTNNIAAAFRLREGPIYFQYLTGDRGLRVNEIACRIGGAYEEIFLPVCTGFDILKANYSAALGRPSRIATYPDYTWRTPGMCLSAQLFFAKPGTVKELRGLDTVTRFPAVIAAAFHVMEGESIGETENATARAGFFIVRAASRQALHREIDAVFRVLQIIGESGENLIIPYSETL